jgi:hypothetical protein
LGLASHGKRRSENVLQTLPKYGKEQVSIKKYFQRSAKKIWYDCQIMKKLCHTLPLFLSEVILENILSIEHLK